MNNKLNIGGGIMNLVDLMTNELENRVEEDGFIPLRVVVKMLGSTQKKIRSLLVKTGCMYSDCGHWHFTTDFVESGYGMIEPLTMSMVNDTGTGIRFTPDGVKLLARLLWA